MATKPKDPPFIDVDAADAPALRAFAQEHLGIEPPDKIRLNDLRDLVRSELGPQEQRDEVRRRRKVAVEDVKGLRNCPIEETVVVIVAEDADGVNPVPLSVNSHGLQIVRGLPVRIPLYGLEVLKNARERRFTQQWGDDGQPVRMVSKEV